ncbi:DNA-binding protein [Serratia fonticola]|uniref:DNA-binding protein n=1 Tax=Serratia fonticola TaxID=47917 RepID=UPI003F5DF65E
MLAIRYAAWKKPEFEIEVYEIFRATIRRGLDAISRLNPLEQIFNTETKEVSQCASKMAKWGVGGRKNMLDSTRQNLTYQMAPDMVGILQGATN